MKNRDLLDILNYLNCMQFSSFKTLDASKKFEFMVAFEFRKTCICSDV